MQRDEVRDDVDVDDELEAEIRAAEASAGVEPVPMPLKRRGIFGYLVRSILTLGIYDLFYHLRRHAELRATVRDREHHFGVAGVAWPVLFFVPYVLILMFIVGAAVGAVPLEEGSDQDQNFDDTPGTRIPSLTEDLDGDDEAFACTLEGERMRVQGEWPPGEAPNESAGPTSPPGDDDNTSSAEHGSDGSNPDATDDASPSADNGTADAYTTASSPSEQDRLTAIDAYVAACKAQVRLQRTGHALVNGTTFGLPELRSVPAEDLPSHDHVATNGDVAGTAGPSYSHVGWRSAVSLAGLAALVPAVVVIRRQYALIVVARRSLGWTATSASAAPFLFFFLLGNGGIALAPFVPILEWSAAFLIPAYWILTSEYNTLREALLEEGVVVVGEAP